MENIRFDYTHAKALINAENIDGVKAYIKQFFFRFYEKIFFFDGDRFILYEREQAMKFISSDLSITRMIANQQTHKFEKVEFTPKILSSISLSRCL